jgi:hypothetical protein
MAKFDEVFTTLRAILEPYAARAAFIAADQPGKFVLSSSTKHDRAGRPLFIASVQVGKSYVSFHLLPLYMNPTLTQTVPPALKKRMQGKACFNFTVVDRTQVKELTDLTKRGIASFKDLQLPWEEKKRVPADGKKKGRAAEATRP